MSETDWRRLTKLLVKSDARAIRNLALRAPSTVAGPALLGLTGAGPVAFAFLALQFAAPGPFAVLGFAAMLPLATLITFGPPRWPGPALSILPLLPTDDRPVYAHSVLRLVALTTLGLGYAMLPLAVILLFTAPLTTLPRFVGGMFPIALAFAAAAAIGRWMWGLVAGLSPRAQLTARLCLAGALSVPALASMAGADGATTTLLFGPFLAMAVLGMSGFPQPTEATVVAAVVLLAAALIMAAAPVRTMPAHPTPLSRLSRATLIADATRTGPLPRSSPFLRRPMAPYPIPAGGERALRYLARQWLKLFLWIPIAMLIVGGIGVGIRLLGQIVDFQNAAPQVTFPQFLAMVYLASIGMAAAVSFPGYIQLMIAPRRKADADRIAMPAVLRVGPPFLQFKRWSYLQTMPFPRRVMERVFLRPLLLLLVFVSGAWLFLTLAPAPLDVNRRFPVAYGLVMLYTLAGAFFVGRHANKRFARVQAKDLEGFHALFAALWLASSIPLLIVAGVGLIALFSPFPSPPDAFVALTVALLAAVGMPLLAYQTARERLVAVIRPWETPMRVLVLGAGAFVFLVIPVALIAAWLSPSF